MEVILREHVDNLGRRGDVVKVADGYARNYLLPRKLALAGQRGEQASDRARAEERRSARARREVAGRSVRRAAGETEIAIPRRVGEHDTLYGSVTSADIAAALAAKGFEIDKRKITLPDPLKALGQVTVPIKIHRDVTAQVKVSVVAEKQIEVFVRLPPSGGRTARVNCYTSGRLATIDRAPFSFHDNSLG